MAALKPEDLAEMRARLFRNTSSGARSRSDTDHISNQQEKKEHSTGKTEGEGTVYIITITVPWSTRTYDTWLGDGGTIDGTSLAISRAVQRDNRLAAVESHESMTISVRKFRSINPGLKKGEVRLLTNEATCTPTK